MTPALGETPLADSEMSGPNAKIEWYLARDGQQHGPLSDPELRKFIELGHLHPTDLVWRAGFPEWRTASEVFPETEPAAPPPPPPAPPPGEASTAAGIETLAPERPASMGSAGTAKDENQSKTDSTHDDATRNDSPTQRDVGATPASQPQATVDTVPSRDKGEMPASVQSTNSAPAHGPEGPADSQSPGSSQPSAESDKEQSEPQFQQSSPQQPIQRPDPRLDPRLGGPEPHPASQPGPNPAGGPQLGYPQGQPTGSGPNPYRGGAPGQQPGPPSQQASWQQQPNPAGMGYPGGGPAGGGQQPGFSGAHPNMYGNPTAGGYPGAGQPQNPTFQAGNPQQQRSSLDDEDDFYDDDDFERQPKRRPTVAALVSLVLIGMVGAGGWFAYANQAALLDVFNELTKETTGNQPGVVAAPKTPSREAASGTSKPKEVKTAAASPAAPAAPQTAAVASYVELPIFKTQFWQSFNALYPAWAKAQESNAGKLQANGKTTDEVLATVVKSLVEWRRENADKILAASPDHLRTLAKTFVSNLQFLVKQDVQACYGYISKGELSPTVLPLFGKQAYVGKLGSQTEAIIAAAQNGTTAKKSYPEPINQDFRDLANLLLKRGWTETDLKMFSDPTQLSNAPASKVCTLVTQWFETQLQMPPSDKQMRLLATSLQPVVRG